MNILKFALSNVFRNKRRTLITMLSIVSASVAIIVFGGYIEFTFNALREFTIKTQLGHFQVARKGYFEKGAGGLEQKFILHDPGKVEEHIRAFPHISTVTQRLSGSGLVSTGEVTLTAMLLGIEPEKETAFTHAERVLEGKQLIPGEKNECVVGEGLAKGLKAKVDDTLTILTTTMDGVINAAECRLTGIVRTVSKTYDAVYLKMHLEELKSLLDTTGVEKILVLLDATKNVPEIEPLLAAYVKGSDMEFRVWTDLAEFYQKVVNLYNSIFNFSACVLAVVVLLSIANTMSMTVFERFREIGTLRAMGETRAGIMKLFLSEGLVIGVIGGALGIVFGLIAAWIINLLGGIYIPAPPGISEGYIAYIHPTPINCLWAFAISVLASAGASLYPAHKASRLDIVKALQHI